MEKIGTISQEKYESEAERLGRGFAQQGVIFLAVKMAEMGVDPEIAGMVLDNANMGKTESQLHSDIGHVVNILPKLQGHIE